MSEESQKRDSLLSEVQQSASSQRRRLAEVRAREHVGAVGWAQSAALEDIMRMGREGLVATDSLRQVVHLTTEQVRGLSMGDVSEDVGGHVEALREIIAQGQEQLTAAQTLDLLVCRALDDVADTPRDDLSVRSLRGVQERVQAQLGALKTILDSARVQATTLQQVRELDRVMAEHQQRVSEIRQISAEDEVTALGEAGQAIVERIAELDQAQSGQLDALHQIGEALLTQVPETGAPAQAQAELLEELAQAARAQAAILKDES